MKAGYLSTSLTKWIAPHNCEQVENSGNMNVRIGDTSALFPLLPVYLQYLGILAILVQVLHWTKQLVLNNCQLELVRRLQLFSIILVQKLKFPHDQGSSAIIVVISAHICKWMC